MSHSWLNSSRSQTSQDHDDPPIPLNPIVKRNSVARDEHSISQAGGAPGATVGGFELGLVILSICLAIFLLSLDSSIISTAVPKITDEFHSLEDVGWYGSAYLLTNASTLLIYGKLYTFLPTKWVYVAALSLFEIGSLICGIAPNSKVLIIGRAVAGLGCSGIFGGAFVIIANTVPLERRPIYSAMMGGVYGIACVAGPLLGGVFTDKLTWRWCFYIMRPLDSFNSPQTLILSSKNLPIGGITIAVVIFLLKIPDQGQTLVGPKGWKERIKLFDPWGTLAFIPAIVGMLLALQWGGNKYPWKSARIIGLFVVSGFFCVIFIGVQLWKQEAATVPPRLLMQRTIFSGALYSFSMGGVFFILTFYMPIWFQAIRGVSAVHSGLDNLPMIFGAVMGSIFAGALIVWTRYYTPFMILSSIIASVGVALISTLKVTSNHTKWIPFQIVAGFGLGLGFGQPQLAAQTALDLSDVPIGIAILMFPQTLGSSLFIAIGQTVFSNKLESGLETIPGIDPAVVISAGVTALQRAVPPQLPDNVLIVYNEAMISILWKARAPR